MKFYELYKNKQITENEIDDYIEEWHNNDSEDTIYEYLGMTESEYALWIEDNIL